MSMMQVPDLRQAQTRGNINIILDNGTDVGGVGQA